MWGGCIAESSQEQARKITEIIQKQQSIDMSTVEKPETAVGQSEHLQRPTEFLTGILGKQVLVKLNSGISYTGVIVCLDGFMVSYN